MAWLSLSRLIENVRRLGSNERGNVGMITGLLLVPLVGATGYGIDYTSAVTYRLKLDAAASAAAYAGADAARALIAANQNLSEESIRSQAITRAQEVFAARAPAQITYVLASLDFTRTGETLSGNVGYSARVPTTFSSAIGITLIPIEGSSKTQVPLAPANGDPNVLVRENFDQNFAGTLSFTTIKNFNGWKTSNAGVEIGRVGSGSSYDVAPPNGATYVGQLDTDANSYMAKKLYLPVGDYELRYFFNEVIGYSTYRPLAICGSTANEVRWATVGSTDGRNGSVGAQSNRIGVYLEPATSDTPPSSFNDTDHNLIDVCLLSYNRWIERSVKITVNAPGFYWLAFQAEGASDSKGGLLNNIRFCKETCAGSASTETFPWAANSLLFLDRFTLAPGYTASPVVANYTLNDSGDKGGASAWYNFPAGWTTTPINHVEVEQVSGSDYTLLLDTFNVGANGSNRSVHRQFLLAPGYYTLTYDYSVADALGATGAWCGALTSAQMAAQVSAIEAVKTSAASADTNRLSVYIDSDLAFAHPEHTTALYNAAVWKLWHDGTAPSSAGRIGKTRVDSCLNASSRQSRTVNFRIQKAGYYWITFAAEGAADGQGARIDTVRLTALGGLSTAPPANTVVVPGVGPSPGSTVTARSGGYSFIAN